MSFADVIGHAEVIAELKRSLADDRLPHALLLAGPAGIGKRTVALALAAARYCEKPRRGDSCGLCAACRHVRARRHPDVEVIERQKKKRDIGIAQVRELLEVLHRAAAAPHGRGRMAILDGAERLSDEAQNAMLKTLEEPPQGSLLVLVTAQPERMLATVRSRCATLRLRALRDAEMARFADKASIAAPRVAAVPPALARGSPGSLLALAAPQIGDGRALILRFVLGPEALSPLLLSKRLLDLATAKSDDESDGEGGDDDDASETARGRLRRLLGTFALVLRDLALLGGGAPASRALNTDRAAELAALAPRIPPGAAIAGVEALEGATRDLARNVDRALLLESTFLRVRSLLGGLQPAVPAGR